MAILKIFPQGLVVSILNKSNLMFVVNILLVEFDQFVFAV